MKQVKLLVGVMLAAAMILPAVSMAKVPSKPQGKVQLNIAKLPISAGKVRSMYPNGYDSWVDNYSSAPITLYVNGENAGPIYSNYESHISYQYALPNGVSVQINGSNGAPIWSGQVYNGETVSCNNGGYNGQYCQAQY